MERNKSSLRVEMTVSQLSEAQEALFKATDTGDVEKAVRLIKAGTPVNCYDATGMSPLSTAAYRGQLDIAELLLDRGANVNDKQHEHGYTPLMFAALSGNADMCRLLMDHGAHSYTTNSINKTASEMAAFIGQHEVVAIINNHVSIDDVEKFLHPQGKESQEIFPDQLTVFIHSLCSSHQIHPVALIFKMSEYSDALQYKKKVLYVVDRVFEKQLRCKESNEVMSIKLWLILVILREVIKFVEEKPNDDAKERILLYAKYLNKMEPGDQVRKNLDNLLRAAIANFPYRQSLLFETMVKAMAKTKIGDRPSAYDYIVQGLFGQRILAVSKFCTTCGTPNATKRCSHCKLSYCSQSCQKFDWGVHKKCCASIKEWNQSAPEDDSIISLDDIQTQVEHLNTSEPSEQLPDIVETAVQTQSVAAEESN